MAGLNHVERATVSVLRDSFFVCRSCKIKVKAPEAEGCPQCGNRLQRPTAPYHESYPTIARAASPATPTAPRFPDASARGRCIYCSIEGDEMQGEGLRKYCRDEVSCAGRVRAAKMPGRPNASAALAGSATPAAPNPGRRPSATPAEVLIAMMQREAGVVDLDGPLDYGVDLCFPIEAAQARNVLFGKSGCGKTHAGAVIAESILAAEVPLCALDKLGNLWGIRCAGKGGPGLPIVIVGGEHGDVPLEWTDGPKLAAIFAQGVPMLIDVSLMVLEQQQDFAADFFHELLRLLRRPAHVLVEEAETFCPAFSRSKAQFAVQGATTLFARQIRNYGVGWTFSTQRQQLLHPDAVDASSAFLAMQNTGDKTQRSIHAEARTRLGRAVADAILSEVGTLPRGEVWLMPDPSWLGEEKSAPIRFRFRDRRTYDSTAVPKIGAASPIPPPLIPVDLRPFARLRGDAPEATTAKSRRQRR